MILEDYDLTERQRKRVERIDDDLDELDQRREHLLGELTRVLDAAPEEPVP